MKKCAFCGQEIEVTDRIGRDDRCPRCANDLHCCLQCAFYDPAAHHECRESSAEFVSDKEKANFCDYYVFDPQVQTDTHKKAGDAKKQFESLFRKKD